MWTAVASIKLILITNKHGTRVVTGPVQKAGGPCPTDSGRVMGHCAMGHDRVMGHRTSPKGTFRFDLRVFPCAPLGKAAGQAKLQGRPRKGRSARCTCRAVVHVMFDRDRFVVGRPAPPLSRSWLWCTRRFYLLFASRGRLDSTRLGPSRAAPMGEMNGGHAFPRHVCFSRVKRLSFSSEIDARLLDIQIAWLSNDVEEMLRVGYENARAFRSVVVVDRRDEFWTWVKLATISTRKIVIKIVSLFNFQIFNHLFKCVFYFGLKC